VCSSPLPTAPPVLAAGFGWERRGTHPPRGACPRPRGTQKPQQDFVAVICMPSGDVRPDQAPYCFESHPWTAFPARGRDKTVLLAEIDCQLPRHRSSNGPGPCGCDSTLLRDPATSRPHESPLWLGRFDIIRMMASEASARQLDIQRALDLEQRQVLGSGVGEDALKAPTSLQLSLHLMTPSHTRPMSLRVKHLCSPPHAPPPTCKAARRLCSEREGSPAAVGAETLAALLPAGGGPREAGSARSSRLKRSDRTRDLTFRSRSDEAVSDGEKFTCGGSHGFSGQTVGSEC
jgi:hypothetical protein